MQMSTQMAISSSSMLVRRQQAATCFRSAAPRRFVTRQRQHTIMAAALKLYSFPRSRSTIIRWYLNELQLPFEDVPIDMEKKVQDRLM